jgi:hypothetical protein
MGLNKEKVMPVTRVRVRGQKCPKSVKRAMALMGSGSTAYKWAMLDAYRSYEELRRKSTPKEKD